MVSDKILQNGWDLFVKIHDKEFFMEQYMVTYEEYLLAAGNEVFRQLAEEPYLGIELPPDVAEFMGAFEEKAFSYDDI